MKEKQKLYIGRSIREAYERTTHIDHWNARK